MRSHTLSHPSGSSDRIASWLFHSVCVKNYTWAGEVKVDDALDFRRARTFISRFGDRLDVADRTLLDVGCGTGALCIEAAVRGAKRAVGVEIQGVAEGNARLRDDYPDLRDRVEFIATDGSLCELGDRTFDIVVSQNSFEHYSDPERFVGVLKGRLAPGGSIVIGFAPLWKSPLGGHISYMTRLPWAHLIFPERVVLAERRRFRPHEHAERYQDIVGGLNRMTLRRFRDIAASTGLQPSMFEINLGRHPALRIATLAARLPGLQEYATHSVYAVLSDPTPPSVALRDETPTLVSRR